MNRNLLMGGLVLLFLFGCAGKQAAQAPSSPQPAMNQSGLQVGDSDIAPLPPQNESDILSNEAVVPPENATAANATAMNGTMNQTAPQGNLSALPSDSDLSLVSSTNEDLISQEDVVQPG